jgi:TolB-like protein
MKVVQSKYRCRFSTVGAALLVCIALGTAAPSLLAQDRPTVAVYNLANPSGDQRMETLSTTVTDTVALSLALMGAYDVVRLEEPIGRERVSEVAAQHGYEGVVYGEAIQDETGYSINASVYDLIDDRTTVDEEIQFESVLDAFGVSDRLVVALMEGITGETVSYGSLRVVTDTVEPFRTEIDGVDMGVGFTGIDTLLSGAHEIAFFQERGIDEVQVDLQEFDLPPDGSVSVTPVIPWLVPAIAARLTRLEREIAAFGNDDDRSDRSAPLFEEAISLVSAPFYQRYRPSLVERYEAWRDDYELPMNTDDESRTSVGSSETLYLSRLGAAINRSMPTLQPLSVETRISNIATTIRKINDGSMTVSVLPWYAEITVDGRKDDWAAVATTERDRVGDQNVRIADPPEGSDIAWTGIATDGSNLYVAFETADSDMSRNKQYYIDIEGRSLVRLGWDYDNSSDSFVGRVPNRNWSRSQWGEPSTVGARGVVREILEYSIPLSRLRSWGGIGAGSIMVTYEIQTNDKVTPNWTSIDTHGISVLLFPPYYEMLATAME